MSERINMNQATLVGSSKSMNETDTGSSLLDQIAYYARVSNPTSSYNSLRNDKLIQYLINHRHWSPFEMVDCCLDITTTRAISRQLIRHRSFSFQEFSQRYAATETGSTDWVDTRLQDTTNRQSSIPTTDAALRAWWLNSQKQVNDLVFEIYDAGLKKGIAKELMRSVLPEGLTRTRLYMKGSIRSWIHYIDLRTDPSTQAEHRNLARMCAMEIAKVMPYIAEFVQPEKTNQ
tara:strand:- start:69 stop:764 length:696 start_codon:yes stop_codon:yes gene_type:complete